MKKQVLVGSIAAGLFLSVTAIMAANGKISIAADGTETRDYSAYAVGTAYIQEENYTSVSDVAAGADNTVFASDATGCRVYQLSSEGEILKSYESELTVNGVYAGTERVYALEGELAGTVTVLDQDLVKVGTVEVGHTPVDMVVSGTTGYVANRYSNTVSVLDLETNKVIQTIDISGREPQALTLAGDKVYVACHLPEEGATETLISANVAVIDTANNEVIKTMDLINGAGGVKGICASPDGKTVYVSHIIARYTYPTTQLDRGWINTNGISVIDTASDSVVTSMMLDEVDLGAANPWGIAVSGDGTKLMVALSGNDELMVVDIAAMNQKIQAVQAGSGVVEKMEDIPNYLPFLDDCRERIALSGKGARALCTVGDKVYVGLYFAGSIDEVSLTDYSVQNMTFVDQPEADAVRKGEIIFSDATLCYQKWQSCLSCHPDARVDGYNWDNLNDGIGNPKSAKSMLYAHRTPPAMSTGIRASAEISVRAGMKYIQFNALEEEQMAYMDEYLKSLQPLPSPYLNRDGTLTESAERGEVIFNEVGCAVCHPAPLYTDLKIHETDLTEDTFGWESRPMDTPTLVEVWRTGPWAFDGRFAVMEEAIGRYAAEADLTKEELTDLTNFVLSIGNETEPYGIEQVVISGNDTAVINKLAAGGTVEYFTLRRQLETADTSAVVKLSLVNGGREVAVQTKEILAEEHNMAIKLTPDESFELPVNLNSDATLRISITDQDGNPLASDLVITY